MSEPKSPVRRKPVPTKLKRLAERRARLAGLVELSLASDKPYIDELDALLEKLSLLEERLAISALQRNEITTALSALDEEIVKLSPNTDPSKIQAIFGWKDRYGKRGAFRQYILDVLKSHHPEYIGFTDLADLATKKFGLTFATASEKVDWRNKNLRDALKELRNQLLIESIVSPTKAKGQKKLLWRFKLDRQPTLAELAALDG
ncbi:MAG: hypothetical protein Q7K57_25755 [Burkholderiaceae bacterium]|nr:hypothetical protein [Burkholderiaceae bacterium]